MQLCPDSFSTFEPSRGGGRIASERYRQSLRICDDFEGLEENTNRYQLLLLVKQAGKAAGFTPRMIQLLDYYMAYTRDIDWERGARPIVYQSLARTALDLGVTERQVQRLEKELFAVGAVTWNDSGNHKRYGQRDAESGAILYAFGVDLTPLAYLQSELREKLQEKRLHDAAWLETKRQVSWYRGQIRAMLLEWQEEGGPAGDWQHFAQSYEDIAVQIRTHLTLEGLRSLLARHKTLQAAMLSYAEAQSSARGGEETRKPSPRGDLRVAHYNTSTQESSDKSDCRPTAKCFQESVAGPPAPDDPLIASGMQHISLHHAVKAASARLRVLLPEYSGAITWPDLTEAAARLRIQFGISQASWGEACAVLGRSGAAVCLIITDRATLREQGPALCAPAYFRGMVNKARAGQLRLHSSVFGLLEQERERLTREGGSAAAESPAPGLQGLPRPVLARRSVTS